MALGLGACGAESENWISTESAALPPPTHDASLVGHTFPAIANPGERLNVCVTMFNDPRSGGTSPTDDWLVGQHYFRSRNSPFFRWFWPLDQLTAPVTVGNNGEFCFVVTVPNEASAEFRGQMFFDGGFYGDLVDTGAITINAGNQRRWDCSLVSQDLPATMEVGEVATVNLTVQNTGSASWNAGEVCLRSTDTPINNWSGPNCAALAATVMPTAQTTFTFDIVAPTTPNAATPFGRQMFGLGQPSATGGVGFFDQAADCLGGLTVNVQDTGAGLDLDSQVISQNFPTQMTPGQTVPVSVTMRNTGQSTWTNTSEYFFYSQSSPVNFWGVVNSPVSVDTANGVDHTFNFTITAPMTPGTYAHEWSMRKTTNPNAGFFGGNINISVDVVASGCGNGVTERGLGETCDDGNTTASDGCSAICVIEPQVFDMAVDVAGRTFQSTNLDNVQIADLNGDGVEDVIVAQTVGVDNTGTASVSDGGTVIGYAGGAGFFSGATTMAPTGSFFTLLGGYNDELGGGFEGRIEVANVTGSGGNDLVVSAAFADGVDNLRADAGEVYVLPNAGLSGGFSVASEPAPAAVRARIVGPVAGGQARVIATADVDSDGFADIFVGVPLAAPNGRTDAGEVYVIRGGPTLMGVVDLSTVTAPTLIARFEGENGANGGDPGDQLGHTAAVGNITGDTSPDVILGSQLFSPLLLRGGAVFVFQGPVSGTYDLATDFSGRWRSNDPFAGFGQDIAIAHVRGSTRDDVIIGGHQILNTAVAEPASQRGGILVIDGLIGLGQFDVGKDSDFSPASTRIFGEEFGDTYGSVVNVSGDFNGDGLADILSTAPNSDGPANGTIGAGSASIIIGGESMAAIRALTIAPQISAIGVANSA